MQETTVQQGAGADRDITPGTPEGRSARGPWPARRADVVGGVAAAIGSLLAATFAMQLWHANLHVPFTYGSDALLT